MMRGGRLAALLLVVVLVRPAPGAALTAEGEEAFFRANQAYREGSYEEAAEGYRDLIRGGGGGGHLHYNLGNAEFRLDRLGPAILSYERARLLLPRDADLRFNLEHAREQLLDALPPVRDLLGEIFFWLEVVTLAEVFWLFVLVNLLFWTSALLRLFFPAEGLYYGFVLLLILWVAAGASFGVKWYQVMKDNRAVVLAAAVRVRAGPEAGDTVLFKLHAGAMVKRERTEGGWALIRLSDGKRGWVRAEAVGGVREKGPPPSVSEGAELGKPGLQPGPDT